MDKFRVQIEKSMIMLFLVGICFGGSDLELGGNLIISDGNWIGLGGTGYGRILFDEQSLSRIVLFDCFHRCYPMFSFARVALDCWLQNY